MNIKNIKLALTFSLFSLIAGFGINAYACTSAIISGKLNPSGRPILWKHRDTSTIDNKIEYVAPVNDAYGYVALFNAADKDLKEAWMGMNEAGFAVMNTASYNIKNDNVSPKKMDKEGYLMTKALKSCRTIDDFERLLEKYPKPMGVEANFGVIDASGEGAFFETNNYSWVRYNLSDAPDGVLVRTNYSHSGRKGEGYGYIREKNAEYLLQPFVDEKNVTPEVLTEVLSRTFYHDGKKHDFTFDGMADDFKVKDEDFIPRYKSTATVAIEGCQPLDSVKNVDAEFVKNEYIMWTGMGYPPVAEIKAVRYGENGIPEGLRGSLPNGHCVDGDVAKKIRDAVFEKGQRKNELYVNLHLLYNEDGTGFAQQAREKSLQTYKIETGIRDDR